MKFLSMVMLVIIGAMFMVYSVYAIPVTYFFGMIWFTYIFLAIDILIITLITWWYFA